MADQAPCQASPASDLLAIIVCPDQASPLGDGQRCTQTSGGRATLSLAQPSSEQILFHGMKCGQLDQGCIPSLNFDPCKHLANQVRRVLGVERRRARGKDLCKFSLSLLSKGVLPPRKRNRGAFLRTLTADGPCCQANSAVTVWPFGSADSSGTFWARGGLLHTSIVFTREFLPRSSDIATNSLPTEHSTYGLPWKSHQRPPKQHHRQDRRYMPELADISGGG